MSEAAGPADGIEVSFVMPCLDEAETLEACIATAQRCIAAHGLAAEVVVADNGSRDGSQELARRCGAVVTEVEEKGYGSALLGGFAAARGRFVVMGDADMSYDFGEAMPMIEKLRDGADLVMGSRFRGRIEPGAMPWLHRWIGNPVLTWIGRVLFGVGVSDFHCGLRALRRDAARDLNLRTTGMEFASEMVVKAAARGLRIEEVPITLRPDGRSRPPHLRSFRDGWRHLRFMLCLAPFWTLLLPGALLFGLGVLLVAALYPGPLQLGSLELDVHTMMIGSLLTVVGYQAATVALAARIFALEEEIGPPAPWAERAERTFTLERGLLGGGLLALAGVFFIGNAVAAWAEVGFGNLEPVHTMRPVIAGATITAVGVQTALMSFVYSILGIGRVRRR